MYNVVYRIGHSCLLLCTFRQCPIVSTNDWRAQQAPYHILVMVHVWHAGMLLHAVGIVREHTLL